MAKRYRVTLTNQEREQLRARARKRTAPVRMVRWAQALLLVAEDKTDQEIAEQLRMGVATLERLRRRFVDEGLEASLRERPRPGARPKLGSKEQAFLVALARTRPPRGAFAGRCRCWPIGSWNCSSSRTLRTKRSAGSSKEPPEALAAEAVGDPFGRRRVRLSDGGHSRPLRRAVRSDPPVVCFDETSKQLVAETRMPLPMEPGKSERVDYQYERKGTANIFLVTQLLGVWRHVDVTDCRTKHDFAHQMRDLVDHRFPDAERIRVVLDNLNTHTPAALFEAFPPVEARRLLRKLDFHYTSVHGSWLNMAELEFSLLSRQCLGRRIGDRETLATGMAAWEAARNDHGSANHWQFTVDVARCTLCRLQPV
jgi:transposase